MKTKIFPITTFALGCCLLLSHLASAASGSAEKLDQIIVSGSRTPLSINQLGSSVSVISREEIERREARSVSELLRSVPGFAVSHTGVSGSQTQIRTRGAEANHILVLIDGVRANDPATGDEFRWEYLGTGNIERIEIVRGPQSSLWGSDAVSAVVHIITRDGSSGKGVDGYVEGGSFDTTNAALNAALGGNGWSLSGSIENHQTDGQNISRTGNEKDGAELTTAALSARIAANNVVTLRAGLRAIDAYSQFDPVDFFVTGLPVDGDVATDTTNLYANIGIDISPAHSNISQHLNLRYFDSDNQNLIDGIEDSSTASERLTFAWQADFQIGDNKASLGLEHDRTNFKQRGAVGFGDPNQDQEMDATGIAGEYQGLAHKLTWILSARFDKNSDFDDAVNGRLALSYPLAEPTTLRASVGTGQKNPTFIERYGFFTAGHAGNPDLKPERSVSWEIGARQEFAQGTALLDVALFRQDLQDEINGFVFDPVTFLSTSENMNGKSKRSGAEVSLHWSASDTFGISAHYTYTDSTEPDFAGKDSRELRRPRHSGGIGADFQTLEQRFSTTLTADFGGERTDIFFPPWPNPSEIVKLDGYWLVDLTAQYRATDSVTVFAKGTNLLDESYEQVFGYRTLGRATYVGVRVGFGR
jgi:vitamin B12 transporter